MRFTHSMAAPLAGVFLLGMTGCLQAEEKTVKIMMPWEAEGNIYSISAEEILFMGDLKGVMYVEKAEGKLDAAFASCPGTQHIVLKSKATAVVPAPGSMKS